MTVNPAYISLLPEDYQIMKKCAQNTQSIKEIPTFTKKMFHTTQFQKPFFTFESGHRREAADIQLINFYFSWQINAKSKRNAA